MEEFSKKLLSWYDKNNHDLPWRVTNYGGMQNIAPNPYHIWLSEIMLQQTTVKAVKSYYSKFINKWATVQSLAAAPQDDVLTAWAGLGYYARARNLHKCAQYICKNFDGEFPQSEQKLLKLPGVGVYTAAAIAAIAFNKKANVVDGNIERIFSRVTQLETEFPRAKKALYNRAQKYLPKNRYGDYAQALMDLGRTICQPKNAKCHDCPIAKFCQLAYDENRLNYPKKTAKKPKKHLKTHFFWVEKPQESLVLIQKRPENGLLGNMFEFPSTDWALQEDVFDNAKYLGSITHIFTHIKLEAKVWRVDEKKFQKLANSSPKINLQNNHQWVKKSDLKNYALPSLMQKVTSLAL